MRNQGRGRRRLIITFVLALMAAALAPAAANADSITFAGGTGPEYDQFLNIFPNTTEAQKVGVVLNYGGSQHLVAGTQVQLSPGPLDPGFAAGNVTITVPNDWAFGKTTRVDATATYTSGPLLHITEAHFLTWNPTSYSCALGGTSCLTVSGSRRIDTRTDPHPVTNVDSDAGVVDADVTWDHSAEHDQLTTYVVTRLQMNAQNQPVTGQAFPVSPSDDSFHDQGLLPGTRYCWRVRGQAVVPIGEFGNQVIPTPTPDPEVCKTTGTNPSAPASGPSGPALDGDGQFDLTWGASPSSGVTYEVEHHDASTATWSPLASALSAPSYPAHEAEGTWSYRVRARTAQRGVSDWVESAAPVKVDKTAPSAPVATTDPAAPASGDWFADTVTVSFGGSSDPALADGSTGSGVDADTYTAAQPFDTSGATHTATGTVKDVAGHESAETTKIVKVDASKPTVDIVCPARLLQQGEHATATWTAQDGESGLATTATDTIELDTSTGGVHPVTAPAPKDNVDHAGDEDTCSYEVNTPPEAPGAPAGPALTRDDSFDVQWTAANDADHDTVTYVVQEKDADDADWSDAVSTGTAKYGATLAEGTWSFRVKAVDGRGGESGWVESTQATKVDRSAPSAPVASFGDATLAAGWFKDEVTVSWGDSEDPELADHSAGSGVDDSTYTAPTRVTDQDETEVTGTVRDLIGNGSDQGSTTVKVDATAPKLTVTGCPTGPVLERTAVTVKWTASDDESGLDSAAADEIQVDTSQPGSKTVAIPAARDRVGHVTTADDCQFEVYANTAPDAPTGLNEPNSPRASGEFDLTWDAADDPDLGAGDSITYTVEQRDADSDWSTAAEGLTSLTHHVDVDDGTWEFRVRTVDSFGATSGWTDFAAVKVDGGKPTSPEMTTDPADAVDGWFKDSVTISFGGSEDPALDDGSAGSGVAADGYTAPSTFSQTGSHEVSGTATDRAGNESDPTGPATVKVDATAPTTAATCPTGTLTVGEPAKAPWTASDQGSGLATPASGELTLDTSSPGTHTTSADPVRDRVGHQTDGASCTYSVAYKFVGFSAPINGSAVNAGKTGRTYPVKWRLQRYDGSLISDADAQALVASMTAGQKETLCGSFALLPTDELTESTTGDTSLRYDAGADQFIYNYKAPSTAGCYVLAVRKADGVSTKQVNFTFTR